jgi:hypothetical protein
MGGAVGLLHPPPRPRTIDASRGHLLALTPYPRPMMLAGVTVPNDAAVELAGIVRATGADALADRLGRAVDDHVALLALTSTNGRSSLPRSTTRPTSWPSCAPCS